MIDFHRYQFAPIIKLPTDYEIYDFSKGYDPQRTKKSPYGIGKYDEKRPQMYTTELFSEGRDIHMGIDIAAPIGEPVMSFYHGEIYLFAYNAAAGDYGHTLITHHCFDGIELWALYGHLSQESIADKKAGQKIQAGEVIAWVGDRHENGGWNPHLHFQLSYLKPEGCDMPGVVSDKQRAKALQTYPDPRLVLGNLY